MRRIFRHLLMPALLPFNVPVAIANGPTMPANVAPISVASSKSLITDTGDSVAIRPLVLSAPPRDNPEEGERIFGPIAAYLSSVLGRPVVYRHPTTWGGYQTDMLEGRYDIVFDGPHFVGWRIARQQHDVLVKLPGEFVYTAVVRRNNSGITDLKQLAGHRFCAHEPPNLGTLIMYDAFDNPARQPSIVVKAGYDQIYEGLLKGECDAAMLPLDHLQKSDRDGTHTRIVFRTAPMPQQAFSAGSRLSAAEKAEVSEALRAPAAATALTTFRAVYGFRGDFVPARDAEYAGLANYLRDMRGYN